MKILVLSDSHSGLRFMRHCVETLHPDQIVHLGDYYDDGQVLAEEYPRIPIAQVKGNCDTYGFHPGAVSVKQILVEGVRLFLTHGHLQHVKQGTDRLIREAREAEADAVLYGHTHVADCREENGLWILNPGSCGYFGGSAGWMEVKNGKILSCRILTEADLEAMT